MKKLLFLPLMGLLFTACSVDNEDLDLHENQIHNLNAAYNVAEFCGEMTSYSYGDFGRIEVVNDGNTLFVTIVASEGSSLANAKLHIANGLSGFPTVGQGNLPPGQMNDNEDFSPAIESYTFEFDLNDFAGFTDSDGDGHQELSIASQSTFISGDTSHESWAGDISGNSGGWSYFGYEIQQCEVVDPICTHGFGYWKNHGPVTNGNQENEWPVDELTLGGITYDAMELLNILNTPVSGDEIISLKHHLIAAKLNVANGADNSEVAEYIEAADAILAGEGASKEEVNAVKNTLEAFNEGDQNCGGEVVADPCFAFDQDEYSITLENSYVDDNINDVGQIHAFFLNHVFEGENVPTDGSFDSTNLELLRKYNNSIGNWPIILTTTYTVEEGDCEDSAVLSITITEN